MKRITKKPWFGPRKLFGAGWSPITWQGWTLIVVFIGLDLFAINYLVQYGVMDTILGSLVVIGLLLVSVLLTGDKPNFVGIRRKK
jgi:hypothetical protein